MNNEQIMTTEEAIECVLRFINSHFNNPGKEHARASIPADPRRDDDIRLMAYVKQTGAELQHLRTVVSTVLHDMDDHYDGASDSPTLWMGRHIDAMRGAVQK